MRRALTMALLALGLSGCGHVLIQTNDPQARIYADGAFLGRGEARYAHRMGPPRSMTVTVKGAEATVERKVSREYTAVSFVLGLPGLIVGWQFPENVIVMLPQPSSGGGWEGEPSGWDAPPAGWDAEPASAAVRSGDGR